MDATFYAFVALVLFLAALVALKVPRTIGQGLDARANRIAADAKTEALRLTQETEQALAEMIERRTRAAEAKIAQAERQAVTEIRNLAIDAGIAASAQILAERSAGDLGQTLIQRGIADVRAKLA